MDTAPIISELRQRLLDAQAQANTLPRNRETALVLTKLDEALLWLTQVRSEALVR
jgi:hypothetical protein